MPTPARLATASRLAPEPPAPKTRAAAFSRRSRLRIESARGLRAASRDRTAIGISLTPPLENGGRLRISLTTERRLEPPSVRAAGLPPHCPLRQQHPLELQSVIFHQLSGECREAERRARRSERHAPRSAARTPRPARNEEGLRPRPMWRLHGPGQWSGGNFLAL